MLELALKILGRGFSLSCLEEPRAESWTSCMQSILLWQKNPILQEFCFFLYLEQKLAIESGVVLKVLGGSDCCDQNFALWLVIVAFLSVFPCPCWLWVCYSWPGLDGMAEVTPRQTIPYWSTWFRTEEPLWSLLCCWRARNVVIVWPRLVHGSASLGLLHKHGWNFWSCVSCIYQDYYYYLCWNDLIDFYIVVCVCVCVYLCACSCILLMLSFRMSFQIR